MKPLHLKGAATLAVVALVGIGYQTAMGSEGAPKQPSPAAATAWKVSHHSESLSAEMTDVAPVSADEGWAIGTSQGDDGSGEVEHVLLHRAGEEWKKSALPEGARDGAVYQIEASSPDNVWLFGEGGPGEGKPFAFRWDGEQWKPVDGPPSINLWGTRPATVLGPDDVWVLDGGQMGVAHHWNGSKWTDTELPAKATSVGGSSGDDVWAVGYRDTEGDGGSMSQPAAMHWDGKAWKLAETPEYNFPDPAPPEETASLESVVAVSEDEVWAVGSHTFNHGEGGPEPEEESILLRWDGAEWKQAPAAAADKATMEAASDGAGGLVLSRSAHMTAAGDVREITKHNPVPGRSGKVEEVDKKQKFWPTETALVPGTRQVWSSGVIELGAHGDANFRRGAVLSYDTE